MDGTILGQGTFVSTGAATTIAIPSGCDFINVVNYTQSAVTSSANGSRFYWQLGMGTTGVYQLNTSGALTSAQGATNSFVLFDPSLSQSGPLNNGSTGISAISSATPPVATVGSTAGLSAGTIVRLTNLVSSAGVNMASYNGMDFSVGYGTFGGTSFSIDYMNTLTTTSTGSWRVVGFPITTSNGLGIITTQGLFYPRRRYITNISAAAQAVVTLSVQHNFTVGQEVRLRLPGGSAVWGSYAVLDSYQLNTSGNSGNPISYIITAVDTATGNTHNTITLNVNTTGFGSFTFPSGSLVPLTQAQVVPVGEDTATALNNNVNILGDATQNVGFLGMTLAGGATGPAGVASDVIYWVAGKSTYGGL